MAEIIEFKKERMLPEYEQMAKGKLFTDVEIRKIIKMRESYEYKIGQQSKSIKNYCEYIAYERNLLSMIDERNQAGSIFKMNVKNTIITHMKNLYKLALSKFPEEERLWLTFMKFCKFASLLSEGTTGFERMLKFHGDKPAVWIRAAMWEYQETKNIDRVKELLLRGLQRHPENPELYMKFVNIMLNEASKMSSELILDNNRSSEQSVGLERVIAVYQSSKNKICDIDFLIEMLNTAAEYSFTESLQRHIIDDMINRFPCDEKVWDTLAQRELKGCSVDCSPVEQNQNNENMEIDEEPVDKKVFTGRVKTTLRKRILLAIDIYEAAVKELDTPKMWALYITAMLELNQDLSTQKELKRTTLGQVFRSAYEADRLSEYHYLHYLELLILSNGSEDYIMEVIQKATTSYPNCIKLWEIWMRYYIRKDNEPKVYEIFRKAQKKLAFEAHPLWRLIIQYYQGDPDYGNKVDEMYLEAVKQNSPVFQSFKADYLEWVALTKSMNAARKIYDDMVKIPPPNLQIHQKMASLESVQINPNISQWRRCHEYATHYFGKNQTDVWINYIKFERDFGDPKNMSSLSERAKMTLREDLIDNFISEHNLFTTGVF